MAISDGRPVPSPETEAPSDEGEPVQEPRRLSAVPQAESRLLGARERVVMLLDPGTFVELDALVTHGCRDFGTEERRQPGDGLVTGYGEIDGRTVYAFGMDRTFFGGSLSRAGSRKVCKLYDLATSNGCPVVALQDGGGARIQEGVEALGGYAAFAWSTANASGVVPQISGVLGNCAGGSVYVPAMTDFIVMSDTSHMFVTGPKVVRRVTHQEVTADELGGAAFHATTTGIAHFVARSDAECLLQIRKLFAYLPSNNLADPPRGDLSDPDDRRDAELDAVVPEDPAKPYDVRGLIERVADAGSFLELQREFARNLVVGLVRLDGRTAGVVANQPAYLSGAIDIDASLKAARFIRFCDAFNLPLVTFIDTPGFLPGLQQETGGIIRHGAKLLYAFAEATVPMISLIVGKAYGGGYGAMASKDLRTDLNLAYPGARIAVMGVEAAVDVLFRRQLAAAGDDAPELRTRLIAEHEDLFSTPWAAAESGLIDAIVEPRDTRPTLIRALRALAGKRVAPIPRKHANLPL